jgi:hypothetical protein
MIRAHQDPCGAAALSDSCSLATQNFDVGGIGMEEIFLGDLLVFSGRRAEPPRRIAMSRYGRPDARGTRTAVLGCAFLLAAGALALAQQPEVAPPKPTVPEIFTLTGKFVRVAYNNQGFVTMGYQVAQRSIGEEWLMLEVGVTMRSPTPDYTLKRENISIKTPDGTVIPLATQRDFAGAGYLPALQNRAKVVRDSINYFPVDATRGCALAFFANTGSGARQLAFDEVELSSTRGCVGRLYFKVPGGIKVGQHWLIVKFGESEVQVPFRILTKEEENEFKKSWEDIKKSHDASYKK